MTFNNHISTATMLRFVLLLCAAQVAMPLTLENPASGEWHTLPHFGMGGVLELEVELGLADPFLEIKLGSGDSEQVG